MTIRNVPSKTPRPSAPSSASAAQAPAAPPPAAPAQAPQRSKPAAKPASHSTSYTQASSSSQPPPQPTGVSQMPTGQTSIPGGRARAKAGGPPPPPTPPATNAAPPPPTPPATGGPAPAGKQLKLKTNPGLQAQVTSQQGTAPAQSWPLPPPGATSPAAPYNNLGPYQGKFIPAAHAAERFPVPQNRFVDPESAKTYNNGVEGNRFVGLMNVHTGQIHLSPLVPRPGTPDNYPLFPQDKVAGSWVSSADGRSKVQSTPLQHNSDIPSHEQLRTKIGGNPEDFVGFAIARGRNGAIDHSGGHLTSRSNNNGKFEDVRGFDRGQGRGLTADGKLSENYASCIIKTLTDTFGG
jgi:hypothetical protein